MIVGVMLKGWYDCVDMLVDGGIVVIDYKIGKLLFVVVVKVGFLL